ncbi:MAG: IS4 family transposase [Chromatiaceae bacterium]
MPIKEFLCSEEFAESARNHASDFTRQRSLPLPLLVAMLLNLRKGSITDELGRFFEILHDQPLAEAVTPSAFCQARKKLNPRALMALNQPLVDGFQRHFSPRLWHGLRLLAVDGSTARLPNTDDIISTFGAPPTGASVPLARFSRLYDVLNDLVIEADIESRHVGERVLAGEYLAATGDNDLVLYDRGYPAFWLFALHRQEQRHFCARMSVDFSREVTDFLAGGKKSDVVLFSPSTEARRQCRLYGLSCEPLPLRLIRVPLKGGEIEVLATSLLDEAAYPRAWFKPLYHLRWGVEEGYKREKCRLEIENFSGLSAQVVRQDFYAKIFVLNLASILSWVAQAIADRLYQTRKRAYRVNFANALSKMKDNLVRLFVFDSPLQLLTALVLAMTASVEAVRSDRAYPRKIKPAKLQGFYPNYKRCR